MHAFVVCGGALTPACWNTRVFFAQGVGSTARKARLLLQEAQRSHTMRWTIKLMIFSRSTTRRAIRKRQVQPHYSSWQRREIHLDQFYRFVCQFSLRLRNQALGGFINLWARADDLNSDQKWWLNGRKAEKRAVAGGPRSGNGKRVTDISNFGCLWAKKKVSLVFVNSIYLARGPRRHSSSNAWARRWTKISRLFKESTSCIRWNSVRVRWYVGRMSKTSSRNQALVLPMLPAKWG